MSEKFQQNDDSIRPEQIIEAIEACRPGSNDATEESLAFIADQADFADVRGRIEQIDAKIKKAFGDVAVPPGLEARILASLASSNPPPEAAGSDAVRPRRRLRASQWYLAASAVFVAASLLLALFLQWNATPPLDESLILQAAMAAFDTRGQGSMLVGELSPEVREFPLGGDLALGRCTGIGWQPLADFLCSKGVLYTFTAPGNAPVQLYVLDLPGNIDGQLPSSMPWNPTSNTGGKRASAWQAGGRLYVLVVNGNTAAYRSLYSSGGPIT